MKLGDFLLGAAAGFLVYHIYRKSSERAANKPLTVEEKIAVATSVINDESQKYSDILKKQYDVVMPSDQVAKKVRQKGKEFTERRYAINLNQVKQPVSI